MTSDRPPNPGAPGYTPPGQQPPGYGYPAPSPPPGYGYPPPSYPPGYQPATPPRKRRRIFMWVFLGIQILFLIWLISGLTTSTGPSTRQIATFCGHRAWYPLFNSYADCVKHGAAGLTQAGDLGKGIGVAIIVAIWLAVDFILGISYLIYRLSTRDRPMPQAGYPPAQYHR